MNALEKSIYTTAAKIILASQPQLFSDAVMFVKDVENTGGLSGDAKKAKVHADLKLIFEDASTTLLNVAIELAALLIKLEAPSALALL